MQLYSGNYCRPQGFRFFWDANLGQMQYTFYKVLAIGMWAMLSKWNRIWQMCNLYVTIAITIAIIFQPHDPLIQKCYRNTMFFFLIFNTSANLPMHFLLIVLLSVSYWQLFMWFAKTNELSNKHNLITNADFCNTLIKGLLVRCCKSSTQLSALNLSSVTSEELALPSQMQCAHTVSHFVRSASLACYWCVFTGYFMFHFQIELQKAVSGPFHYKSVICSGMYCTSTSLACWCVIIGMSGEQDSYLSSLISHFSNFESRSLDVFNTNLYILLSIYNVFPLCRLTKANML